jgi:hypothetical protein
MPTRAVLTERTTYLATDRRWEYSLHRISQADGGAGGEDQGLQGSLLSVASLSPRSRFPFNHLSQRRK